VPIPRIASSWCLSETYSECGVGAVVEEVDLLRIVSVHATDGPPYQPIDIVQTGDPCPGCGNNAGGTPSRQTSPPRMNLGGPGRKPWRAAGV